MKVIFWLFFVLLLVFSSQLSVVAQETAQEDQATPEALTPVSVEEQKRMIQEWHQEHQIEFDVDEEYGIISYRLEKPGEPFRLLYIGGRPLKKGGVRTGPEFVAHAKAEGPLSYQAALAKYGLKKRKIKVDGKEMNMVEATVFLIENGLWSIETIIAGEKNASSHAMVQPTRDRTALEIKSPVVYVGNPRIKDPRKRSFQAWVIRFPFLKITTPFDCGQPLFDELPFAVVVDCGPLQLERLPVEQTAAEQIHRFRWFRESLEPDRKGQLCWEKVEEIVIPIPQAPAPVIRTVKEPCPECPPPLQCPVIGFAPYASAWSRSPLGAFRGDNILEWIASELLGAGTGYGFSSKSERNDAAWQSAAASALGYFIVNAINPEINRVDVLVDGRLVSSLREGQEQDWTMGAKSGRVRWEDDWVEVFTKVGSIDVKCASAKIGGKINLTPVPIVKKKEAVPLLLKPTGIPPARPPF